MNKKYLLKKLTSLACDFIPEIKKEGLPAEWIFYDADLKEFINKVIKIHKKDLKKLQK